METSCLTAFITHFGQVCSLEEELGSHLVANGHMGYAKALKTTDQLLFLYSLRPGASEGSFGLNVAKLAGVPEQVVAMAGAVCLTLEATSVNHE